LDAEEERGGVIIGGVLRRCACMRVCGGNREQSGCTGAGGREDERKGGALAVVKDEAVFVRAAAVVQRR
jgi:hypothetical protein